jgi:hypothetical protein
MPSTAHQPAGNSTMASAAGDGLGKGNQGKVSA